MIFANGCFILIDKNLYVVQQISMRHGLKAKNFMTQIYLVRHCESMANRLCSFAGRTDVDISAKGRLQLDCLSEYFKDISIDKVYTSSLKRAYKTAEAINFYHSAPILIDDRFIEMNLGELDGKPVSAMSDEQQRCWNLAPHLFNVAGGESMQEVADRAYGGLCALVADNPGKTIAIATHGGVIRNLMRIIKGYAPAGLKEVDWCDNTGVNHIIADDHGDFFVDFENSTVHLSEEAAATPVSAWTE